MEEILNTVKILKQANMGKENVLAVGFKDANNAPLIINYYTDVNVIYFDSSTIEKLIEKNKLAEVFDKYKITAVDGYAPELMQKINQEVKLINLENAQN